MSKAHYFVAVLKWMDIGSQSFIVLLLYFHKSWGIGVDVHIAELQSQDAFGLIPGLLCLGGVMDQCVSETTWFGLDQVCVVLCLGVGGYLFIHEPVFQLWRSLAH